MRVLIGNVVKTDTAEYAFATREEAEAFYMTLRVERGRDTDYSAPGPSMKPAVKSAVKSAKKRKAKAH